MCAFVRIDVCRFAFSRLCVCVCLCPCAIALCEQCTHTIRVCEHKSYAGHTKGRPSASAHFWYIRRRRRRCGRRIAGSIVHDTSIFGAFVCICDFINVVRYKMNLPRRSLVIMVRRCAGIERVLYAPVQKQKPYTQQTVFCIFLTKQNAE